MANNQKLRQFREAEILTISKLPLLLIIDHLLPVIIQIEYTKGKKIHIKYFGNVSFDIDIIIKIVKLLALPLANLVLDLDKI